MRTLLKGLMMLRMEYDGYKAFSCYDFTDLAPYKTVSKVLERLEDEGIIRKLAELVGEDNIEML